MWSCGQIVYKEQDWSIMDDECGESIRAHEGSQMLEQQIMSSRDDRIIRAVNAVSK